MKDKILAVFIIVTIMLVAIAGGCISPKATAMAITEPVSPVTSAPFVANSSPTTATTTPPAITQPVLTTTSAVATTTTKINTTTAESSTPEATADCCE
jgi:hypothetical protein